METLLHYSVSEIFAESLWSHLHPDDVLLVQNSIRALFEQNHLLDIEFRIYTKENRELWFHGNSTGIYQENGVRYADGLCSDITEQKITQLKFIEEEMKYRSLIQNIPDIAVTGNLLGEIIFISANVERITGYSPDMFCAPEQISWIDCILSNFRSVFLNAMSDHFQKRQAIDIEYQFQRKDGQIIWLHHRSLKTYMHDGIITSGALIGDITEKKRTEEEKKTLEKLLPICANCKKIRDDQGYWNQIDDYLKEHADIEFSHGICNECIKKLYPDM